MGMAHESGRRQRAVVIGASMAGLSAAAVLASRFREVILVERDPLSDVPSNRRGVPQGRHAHALLPGGLKRIEGWFPGYTETWWPTAPITSTSADDILWLQPDGPRAKFASGIRGPAASRALLEHHMRRRVLARPNVSLQ